MINGFVGGSDWGKGGKWQWQAGLGSVIDGTRDYVVTWIEINLADWLTFFF